MNKGTIIFNNWVDKCIVSIAVTKIKSASVEDRDMNVMKVEEYFSNQNEILHLLLQLYIHIRWTYPMLSRCSVNL
jgi:hypothetical protein